ncbi:MAG: 3-deoxy-manno-octulosonate cytidylyltransferase [Phycisphaerae bacterium]|nr:3-deoxy-manno-octulosonate cytidylyltransferase [Phycisphaerae bacterium]
MSVVALIPARFASTRLPGKMLLDRTGKALIVHVLEAVRKAGGLDDIVVAADDSRIIAVVQSAGGKAVSTRVDHRCGTDRLAEAAEILRLADDDVVVNVQGDEPDMPAACIEQLVDLMRRGEAPMATLATPLPTAAAGDPNRVKVVLANNGNALYFSRSPIPFDRDAAGQTNYLLHLGIYAYRVGFLKQFTQLPPTPAEESEKLEQLRALEHGFAIRVAVTDYAGGGIDTPEDYEAFVRRRASR